MTRHFFIFCATFAVGALVALGARTARHQPHAGHDASGAATTRGDYAPLVNNTRADPHAGHAAAPVPASSAPAADPHAGHAAAKKPVNTHCAICGMPVDPSLPTMEYQGQTIGFGCKMCPPKFKAEPDKYGPLYLRNEVVNR